MLELKNICFTRDGRKILDNVSLKIEDDKFIVITGPNGSGKSTLAKIIMGIEKQDSGEILLNGKDITKFITTTFPNTASALCKSFCPIFTDTRVDALIGRETRIHNDIDLFVEKKDYCITISVITGKDTEKL